MEVANKPARLRPQRRTLHTPKYRNTFKVYITTATNHPGVAMPAVCPQCQSRKTASIKATQRLALCAEAVKLIILSRLKACYPVIPKSAAYLTMEKVSQNLVEALARSVQLKLRNIPDGDIHTHVCLACGCMFDPVSQPAQRPTTKINSTLPKVINHGP